MAISKNIKYSFNQIQTALTAFVANIEAKYNEIFIDLPVFILETGDKNYYWDKKFKEIENQEIYLKVPRFVIKINDIQIQQDQLTNKYNTWQYIFSSKIYKCNGRRIPLNITITGNFVSPNFILALENYEASLIFAVNDNVFTYDFLGNTFESAYSITSNSDEKPSLDSGSSANINYTVNLSIELQIHLLIPQIQSIKLLSDIGFNSIKFNINDTDTTIEQNLIITKEELNNENQ